MTRHEIFWSATAALPKTYLNKPLPEKTDVVVVGGGFTGASAALQLAKGGARVILLEAQSVGWGASSRNGGQALSCLHQSLAELIKEHGLERARNMFHASVQAADVVEQIVKEEAIECEFIRCGSIEAAYKPSHFDGLKRERNTLKDVAGYDVQIVTKDESASELGTSAYHGLMINPRSGSLQPAKFVQGMALAAERAGADIHEGTRVLEVERSDASAVRDGIRFTVRTNRGEVKAKEIMLASNAWIGEIVPQFRQRVFPAESFIIATEPLPEDLVKRLIPNHRVVYDTRKTLAYYRLSSDHRMVWGGELTFKGASSNYNMNTLRRGMVGVFPELAAYRTDYFWSGTLGITLDENSHAGQVDGMWYSMCYVGHGVTLATYLGQQMANGILDRPFNNPFDGLRIPQAPVYRDKTWFVNVGKILYRLMDMIG
ncbi:MAG TPA: FAD-binding oxidoreductase [Anaerolineales bacterium]